jgi:hypothetical protein
MKSPILSRRRDTQAQLLDTVVLEDVCQQNQHIHLGQPHQCYCQLKAWLFMWDQEGMEGLHYILGSKGSFFLWCL